MDPVQRNSRKFSMSNSSTMLTTGGRILITTGIYPPKIGGPAQYAKNLKEVFGKNGYSVKVKTFNFEDRLPTGVRHVYFFLKIIPEILVSDFVLALDTFSVGLPSVLAAKVCAKKIITRTGGDFLWEQYVERTGKKVLFRNFYTQEKNNFSLKEKVIFKLTRWILRSTSKVVFSTEWQREIFVQAYGLNIQNTTIIENYYGLKEADVEPDFKLKTIVASSRNLKWKNLDTLKHIFSKKESKIPKDVSLFIRESNFDDFIKIIKKSYAVMLVSLGDISPNMILDAIRYNKPFICTKEVGILDRIKDVGIFVDPLDEKEIEDAVIKLLDKEEYEKWRQKVRNFDFVHTWEDMAREYLKIFNSI